MTHSIIALVEADVETLSGSCPSRYEGSDATTGDLVSLRFAHGTLTVERSHREVFEGDVPDAANQQTCSLAQACAAAGIDLLADGEAPPTTIRRDDVVTVCHGCPTTFGARDVASDDDVELHFRHGTLTVTRRCAEIFSGPIDDAASDGVCTLEQACRAAGIRLVA